MKESSSVICLWLSLILFTVAVPSICILRGKVDYLQREAVKSGAAQWVPNEEDPKILELKFIKK